jgi:hypothetical protein
MVNRRLCWTAQEKVKEWRRAKWVSFLVYRDSSSNRRKALVANESRPRASNIGKLWRRVRALLTPNAGISRWGHLAGYQWLSAAE